MAKALTYKEFAEYAKKYYNKGGDAYYECWDEPVFNQYVEEFGPITKSRALKMFRTQYEIERDVAGYGRY